jgi:hypothetical protein
MLGSNPNASVVIAGIEPAQKISTRPYDFATVGWHRREPRSGVAAGDGGLNTDGKEERFVLRVLGSGVCNRTSFRRILRECKRCVTVTSRLIYQGHDTDPAAVGGGKAVSSCEFPVEAPEDFG